MKKGNILDENSYKEEVSKLAELCKRCGGSCCIGDSITISKLELKKLKEKYDFEQGILKTPCGTLNIIKINKGEPCPFIGKVKEKHSETGCILKGKMRPLGCRLFPLTFLIENGKPKFYLSTCCPYAKEASSLKKWMKKTIEEAKEELKSWTEAEKIVRSSLHKKIHKNHKLIDVELSKL